MKCRVCAGNAVISEPRLCREHLTSHVQKEVRRIIRWVKPEKLLVAVSGGKDSAALAHALAETGVQFEMLYIDLGIDGYSSPSKEAAARLAKRLGGRLHTVRPPTPVPELKQRKEPVCSLCGTVKRYVMNRFAFENGFDYVATGHNMDDVAAITAIGIASGNAFNFKLSPVSWPRKEHRMAGRIKPLYRISEKEILAYALVHGLPVHHAECPLSENNTQLAAKQLLSGLPGFKRGLYRLAAKMGREGKRELFECRECSYPTTASSRICKFCRLSRER